MLANITKPSWLIAEVLLSDLRCASKDCSGLLANENPGNTRLPPLLVRIAATALLLLLGQGCKALDLCRP